MTNNPAAEKAVFFDLDGTLLDTIPLIVDSYQHVYQTCLGRAGDTSYILSLIGMPLDVFFSQYDPELAAKMKKTYFEYNWAHVDTSIGVFLQVPEMLQRLQSNKIPMAIVTSKRYESAMHSLQQFGLDQFFDVVIAMESTKKHKPDPEPVYEAMRQLKLNDPARVVFVGDSIHDIVCAQRAGCRSAMVDWTAMPIEEMRAAAPDLWIENTDQLIDFLDKI